MKMMALNDAFLYRQVIARLVIIIMYEIAHRREWRETTYTCQYGIKLPWPRWKPHHKQPAIISTEHDKVERMLRYYWLQVDEIIDISDTEMRYLW